MRKYIKILYVNYIFDALLIPCNAHSKNYVANILKLRKYKFQSKKFDKLISKVKLGYLFWDGESRKIE